MTLGQALAMMAMSQQPKPQTTPTIPWQQVAPIPPAEDEGPIGFAKLPPVEVTASRLPALPETLDPLSLYEAEMYGAPLAQPATEGIKRTPGPDRSYGFIPPPTEPQPVQAASLPPLPIRGMPSKPQEFMSRPPMGMTDVPMEEPIASEQPLAMSEPTMAQPVVEEPKKPVAPWKPGEPYKITTKDGEYTITGYDPRSMGKSPVRVTDAQGTAFRVEPDVDPEFYNQVSEGYKKQVELSTPPAALGGFTSKVLIGEGDKAQWYDAKVDPATNRVIYKLGNRTAVYETPRTLKLGENFIGGTTEDDQNLVNIQQAKAQALAPAIKRIQDAAQDMPSTADKVKLRSGLSWEMVPGEDPENPMPEVVFYYQDGVNGERMTLQKAEQLGLVTPGTDVDLQRRKLQVDDMLAQRARQIKEVAGTEAKTNFDRELEQIDKQNALLAQEKATASADRVRQIQKIEQANQRRRDALLQQSAVSAAGAGGTTILTGGSTEYKLPFDPDTLTGRLNMFSFEGFDTTGQIRSGATSWSQDDYMNYIVDQAMPNIQTNPLITTPRYKQGVGALAQRVKDVQDRLYEKVGDSAGEAANDDSSVFTYYDQNGNVQYEQMSLTQALDEFDAAQSAYRNNPSQKNMQIFQQKARRLSGRWDIAGLGDEPSIASPAELILKNISSGFDMPVSISTRVPGTPVSPSGTLAIKPPAQDVVGPRSGGRTTPPPTPKVDAFPLFQMGNDKKSYMRWDAGFNPFQVMVASPEAFDFQAIRNSTGQASTSVGQNMANSLFDEDGILSPAQQQAASKFADELNKKIAGPEGKDARRAIADSFYDSLETFGFMAQIPRANFISDLEAVYDGRLSMADFRNKYATDAVLAPYFARSAAGVETLNAPNGSDYKGVVNVAGTGKTSKLYEQGKLAIEQIGYLFKNSGAGGAEHATNSGAKVKWVVNPFRPGYLAGSEFSVLTIPASTNVPSNALITDQRQAAPNPSSPKSLPGDGLVDISGTYAMNNIAKILGKSTTISPLFDIGEKANTATGNSLTDVAKNNFPSDGNLYKLNDQVRKTSEENTQITGATNESVVKGATYTILMHSLFPEKRFRNP